MKIKKPLLISILVCWIIVSFTNCSSPTSSDKNVETFKNDTTKTKVKNKTGFDNTSAIIESFYQIPAPDEMFGILRGEKLRFQQSLLVPSEQLIKLVDSKSQALFMGIYSADLAYCVSLEQYQTSITYFALVRKLADKIGISSVFDEPLVSRIQNNLNNVDSLQNISNESYFRIVDYLMEIESGKTLMFIASGGWLEGLYLITNAVNKYSPNDFMIQRVADQKNTIDNLLVCIAEFNDDPYITKITKGLTEIKNIYAQCTIENTDNKKSIDKNGKIVLSGGTKVVISETQFNELKTKISDLRNSLLTK